MYKTCSNITILQYCRYKQEKKNEASLSIGINCLHFYGFPYF